jgi:molybdenum cofactor synthesis domain-containing protein
MTNTISPSRAMVVVSSDRAAQNVYIDEAGPVAKAWLEDHGFEVPKVIIVPDDREALLNALEDHHHNPEKPHDSFDLIVVSGGTGLGTRDHSPQVIARYADYEIPGFGEIMRAESRKFSPKAFLSRCGAWVIGTQLILAIPGSPKATREQLDICRELIPAALKALKNQCDHHQHPERKTPL